MSENTTKNPEKLTCFFARPNSEVFAREEGGKPKISGYAAMYDTFSEDLGGFRTKIAPGAFDRVLAAGADCRMLVNHDANLIFGRTTAGTLLLKGDAKGLYFENDPPDSDLARHYMGAIARGDMDGCSFTCDISIDQWDFSGETVIRTIQEVSQLYDVGPVTFPAFLQTPVTVSHALEAARAACIVKILRPSLGLMRLGLELAR